MCNNIDMVLKYCHVMFLIHLYRKIQYQQFLCMCKLCPEGNIPEFTMVVHKYIMVIHGYTMGSRISHGQTKYLPWLN